MIKNNLKNVQRITFSLTKLFLVIVGVVVRFRFGVRKAIINDIFCQKELFADIPHKVLLSISLKLTHCNSDFVGHIRSYIHQNILPGPFGGTICITWLQILLMVKA